MGRRTSRDRPQLNPDDRIPITQVPRMFNATADFGEERKRAQLWARKHIRGQVENADTNWVIEISRRGIESATARKRAVRDLDVLQVLPQLLRTAKYVEQTLPDQPEEGILAYHQFFAPIDYDGKLHRVQLTVKELDSGRHFYDQHSFEMQRPGAESEAPGAEALRDPRLTPATGADINLGDLLRGVKYRDGTLMFP